MSMLVRESEFVDRLEVLPWPASSDIRRGHGRCRILRVNVTWRALVHGVPAHSVWILADARLTMEGGVVSI